MGLNVSELLPKNYFSMIMSQLSCIVLTWNRSPENNGLIPYPPRCMHVSTLQKTSYIYALLHMKEMHYGS